MKHQDALAQLTRETKRARQRLTKERALRVGFWFNMAGFAWAAAALSGLHERLPLLLQSLTALAALGGLGFLAYRTQRAWKRPTEAEARARLASDSRLDLGAFEALSDRPSRFDAFSLALWKREQEQAYQRAGRARAGPTRPYFDDIDRFRVRYLVVLAVMLAVVFGGGDATDRLSRAFLPDPGPLVGDGPFAVEAWATPAAYTHGAPVSLSDRVGERIETPPSIAVTVRVTGPRGAPRLVFEGRSARVEARFTRAADGAWEARMAVPEPGRLKIVRFHTRASWAMAPAPDLAPRAVLTAPLAALPQERVTFAWRADDDFGISRMALRVRPVTPPEGLAGAAPVDTVFESPAGDPREAMGEQTLDLAAHPYAGMDVEARIVAFDALGNAGESQAMRFTLPEKIFLQPLARAAIEIRRKIQWEARPYRGGAQRADLTMPAGDILLGVQRIAVRDYEQRNDLARAPQGVRRAVTLLDALTMLPQDHYFRDLAVYLGLKRARAELQVARGVDHTEVAADILWRTALRAEYGGAADARRALEQAQRALSEALAAGAPQERLRQLIDALRRATDAYLQSMVQQAIRNGTPQNQDDTQDQASISEQDIQDLLQQVQRLTEQGRTQEAQALLAMLAQVLSNLDARLDQSNDGDGQGGQSDQQMQQSMDNLSDTIGQQRALRDDTQQQDNQQNPENPQQAPQQGDQRNSSGGSSGQQQGGQGGGGDLAQRQAQIRESLSQAQHMAGAAGAEPSQALNDAARAMQQSENALRRGDFAGAQSAQNTALEQLRQGADQLAADIRARGGREARSGQTGPRDPLGRLAPGGGVGDGDTAVPTQIDPARAREIFDQIRRRAQDPNRPEAEREYLRRLMDRFDQS